MTEIITDDQKGLTIRQFRQKLYEFQERLKEEEQVEMPVLHDYAPGVYLRRILMPADTFVIGKTHRTEHMNIVFSGSASVMIDGDVRFLTAGDVFTSGEGIKKILYIHEEMVWGTIHPTDERDMDVLEKQLVLSDEEEKKFLTEGKKCLGQQSL
jgi:hypothetical protein